MHKLSTIFAVVGLIAYGVITCVILHSIDGHLDTIARSLQSMDEHLDTMDTETSLSNIDINTVK